MFFHIDNALFFVYTDNHCIEIHTYLYFQLFTVNHGGRQLFQLTLQRKPAVIINLRHFNDMLERHSAFHEGIWQRVIRCNIQNGYKHGTFYFYSVFCYTGVINFDFTLAVADLKHPWLAAFHSHPVTCPAFGEVLYYQAFTYLFHRYRNQILHRGVNVFQNLYLLLFIETDIQIQNHIYLYQALFPVIVRPYFQIR